MYITRKDVLEVIKGMQKFESSLIDLYSQYSYDLHENIGRRNILLSTVQEKETARVLSKKFSKVLCDGSPGKPDVVICDIEKELECKLTSGSHSKGSVSYALQTDYATIQNKEKLDYLYIIASDDFSGFCAIFFEGLTAEDFFPPASGSRGKSRMRKEKAMKKATALVGDIINVAEDRVLKIEAEIIGKQAEKNERINQLTERYNNTSENAVKKRESITQIIFNEVARYDKSIKKLKEKKVYWEVNSMFSFNLEKVEESQISKDAA